MSEKKPLYTGQDAFNELVNHHLKNELEEIKSAIKRGETNVRLFDLSQTQIDILKKLGYNLLEFSRKWEPKLGISVDVRLL